MGTATLGHRIDRAPPPVESSTPAFCEGDAVVAEDRVLGPIDLVARSDELAYVVVGVGGPLGRRYPVVPVSVVTHVDSRRRVVELRRRRDAVRRFPEALPLVL